MFDFELTSFNFQFIRVAIIDDHKLVAEGFERIINASNIARVIGKAFSVAGCRELFEKSNPDVVLMDVSLPDGNGIDLCKEIKTKYPQVKVIMLTSYGEIFTVNNAFDTGADGYIIKSATQEEVIEGIKSVVAGKRYLCNEISELFKKIGNKQLVFSRRERELLQLIAEGKSSVEQADKMCLGINTIRGYRQKLLEKLDAHNTAQLIHKAKELRLIN